MTQVLSVWGFPEVAVSFFQGTQVHSEVSEGSLATAGTGQCVAEQLVNLRTARLPHAPVTPAEPWLAPAGKQRLGQALWEEAAAACASGDLNGGRTRDACWVGVGLGSQPGK